MPVGVEAAAVSNGHHTRVRYVRRRDTAFARFAGATCRLFQTLRTNTWTTWTALHPARRRARVRTRIRVQYRHSARRAVLSADAAPRRLFTRTARHRREDEDGNVPIGNAAWFRKWNVTSYEEYYALRELSFYVEHPCVDELTRNDFARKFRLPYETVYALYEEMKHDDFMRERSMAVPMKIKLLASLRYLALGVPWDAMEDIVNVSRRTLRTWFYKKFLPWMMKHKYHEHVQYPTTSDEVAVLMDPWTRAGFPGCIACVDGVHIPWGGYRAGRKYMYVGKEGVPTLGFNVTIDYDGRIIFCSDRQRGSVNDKTAIKFDELNCDVL